MLYYACYIPFRCRCSCLNAHTYRDINRDTVRRRREVQHPGTLALKIHRNFQRNQHADSTLDPIGFNGASGLVKRIFDASCSLARTASF